MLFRSPPEDHLTEFFDRDITPPEQFHEGQNGSEQSLYFLFGAWLQIRSSNLLDQILDFGGIGARRLVLFGHGRSLTSLSGMTNTSTNHYHSLRLIGGFIGRCTLFSRTHAGLPKEHNRSVDMVV